MIVGGVIGVCASCHQRRMLVAQDGLCDDCCDEECQAEREAARTEPAPAPAGCGCTKKDDDGVL